MSEREADALVGHIEAKSSVVPVTGCWMWMGHLSKPTLHAMTNWWSPEPLRHRSLYKTTQPAYRLSLAASKKMWLFGGTVDHLCCHPWCVNPDHLDWVTHRENRRRSVRFHTKKSL